MMADVLTPAQRRFNMSRIRGGDTKPELMVRKGLHALGFRYRVQDRRLPGRPDIVFSKYKAVIFVHGCFWHGHQCPMFKLPATRRDFWKQKITSNQVRDARVTAALLDQGWRVANVWECSLKGPGRLPIVEVLERCQTFLLSEKEILINISGTGTLHEKR